MLHISLKPEILGKVLGVPISNSLTLSLIVSVILITLGLLSVKRLKMVPGTLQNTTEIIIENILKFIESVLGSREEAKRFFPIVASFFIIILFNNWFGILPGIGSLGFYKFHNSEKEFLPLFRSANSDLNTTLALAAVAMIAVQIYGIKKLGFFAHLGKFIVLNKGPIHFFVGLLEMVGEFAKVMSFAFRLFGNIFAGEVLLVIIMTLAPILAPTPFLFLELFVGFIQALVFATLTLIFLKIASEKAEH